jgi:hypothetical protein
MNHLIEKIYAFLNDLFEDDIDEEAKVETRENAGETGIDNPNADPPSLSGKAFWVLDLVLSVFTAIPIFCAIPITGKLLYHTGDKLYMEHLLGLALISMALFFLFQFLRKYMYVGLSVLLLAYFLNQKEQPSFESFMENVVQDYKTASAKVIRADVSWRSIETLKKKKGSLKYFREVLRSDVSSISRNFAVSASTQYYNCPDLYDQYGDVVRYLSLFKFLNENFSYVHDPVNRNYYSTAKETIENGLAGDCDEWAGLVYKSVRAIGGQARLIRTSGHIYPEVMVGSSAEFELSLVPLLDSLFKKA